MHAPLNEIGNYKKQDVLRPVWERIHFYRHQIRYSNRTQHRIEGFHKNIRQGVVNDERKKKEIEKHVKEIQPEIFSYPRLFFSPWKKYFQSKNQNGNEHEPVKIIVPGKIQNLVLEVIPITRV
jgi:hypothetical protein